MKLGGAEIREIVGAERFPFESGKLDTTRAGNRVKMCMCACVTNPLNFMNFQRWRNQRLFRFCSIAGDQ